MTPAKRPAPPKRKSDVTALALMIGMILAVGVTSGASFSAAGAGALQQTLRALGFGHNGEIAAQQRKQATTLAELERIITRMDNEIGGLTTRLTEAESSESTARGGLEELKGDFAALNLEFQGLRARSEASSESWRKPVDHLNAAVAGARSDIITLRSSLDAYEQTRRSDLGAISRRIDRLEKAIAATEATSSVSRAQPFQSEEAAPPSRGLLDILGLRGTGNTANDASTGHVIDMGLAGH